MNTSIMTINIMATSIMTISIMATIIMTTSIMTTSTMATNIMAISIMTTSIMTGAIVIMSKGAARNITLIIMKVTVIKVKKDIRDITNMRKGSMATMTRRATADTTTNMAAKSRSIMKEAAIPANITTANQERRERSTVKVVATRKAIARRESTTSTRRMSTRRSMNSMTSITKEVSIASTEISMHITRRKKADMRRRDTTIADIMRSITGRRAITIRVTIMTTTRATRLNTDTRSTTTMKKTMLRKVAMMCIRNGRTVLALEMANTEAANTEAANTEASIGAANIEVGIGAASTAVGMRAASTGVGMGTANTEAGVGAANTEVDIGAASTEVVMGAASIGVSMGTANTEAGVGAASTVVGIGATSTEVVMGATNSEVENVAQAVEVSTVSKRMEADIAVVMTVMSTFGDRRCLHGQCSRTDIDILTLAAAMLFLSQNETHL
jgi:hypothetical protein